MKISLYLHIPFCAKKCRYCDFYSVPYDEQIAQKYLAALSKEMALYNNDQTIKNPVVQTIYIGGGTPSVLSVPQLRELCTLVNSSFTLAQDCEWTVECNPDSFTGEKAETLLACGATRLSFGMQSMNDRELSLMGRVHSSARSKEILFDPTLSGFTSIGVDVMYGLPGQTIESLSRTLEPVFASPYVRHISAYELTIAHDTPFGRHRSLLPLPGQERMETLTETLWQTLEARGYKQYEVSNFALEGHCCRHNEVYWDHGQYLGLGCAAHSFIGKSRWANVKDLSHYIFTMNNGSFALEFKEQLDYEKLAMEMVFLGLRRVRGIDEEAFKTRCGADIFDYVNRDKLYAFMEEGLLTYNKPFWAPTKKGLLLADAMARELA